MRLVLPPCTRASSGLFVASPFLPILVVVGGLTSVVCLRCGPPGCPCLSSPSPSLFVVVVVVYLVMGLTFTAFGFMGLL